MGDWNSAARDEEGTAGGASPAKRRTSVMGSLNRELDFLSVGSLVETTRLLWSKFPGSQVARLCGAALVALSEYPGYSSDHPDWGEDHARETDPARLRFEDALVRARREPLASEADMLPKCVVYRHLVEWVGEEDWRVQRFGAAILDQITDFFMAKTDQAVSGF